MKNQYFGDTRDLFKYDLIIEMLKSTPIKHFAFIPMLTNDDNRNDGRKKKYIKGKPGTKNEELCTFLKIRLQSNRRNINELETFKWRALSPTKNIRLTIYKKDEYFNHEKRNSYFRQINKDLLANSVILVDPDNGLEVKYMREKEKYITYGEVRNLYNKMAKSCVFMIYQHIPRKKRNPFFKETTEKLYNICNNYPLYISDNAIVFFFLVKNSMLNKSISSILEQYCKRYKGLIYCINEQR